MDVCALSMAGHYQERWCPQIWMNFRKNSKRPLNPPLALVLVSENYVALFEIEKGQIEKGC